MNFKKLQNDDSAVSPVIGVILMVAITVILAAVIASFVLGMGPNTATTPTASFSSEINSDNHLVITMDSGTAISADQVEISAENSLNSNNSPDIDSNNVRWSTAPSSSSEITAGSSISIGIDDHEDYQVQLIYHDGDTTSTMQTFED